MKKITGHKPPSVSAAKAPEKAAKTEKAAAKSEARETAKPTFPRTGWADAAKLAKSIDTAHATQTHPRLIHAKPPRDVIGGEPTRPSIAARYGTFQNPGRPTTPPTVAARYGTTPSPGHPTTPPTVAARYGTTPSPGHPTTPPTVAARYGTTPSPGRPTTPPTVAARYGTTPSPGVRPGIPANPRPGHGHGGN